MEINGERAGTTGTVALLAFIARAQGYGDRWRCFPGYLTEHRAGVGCVSAEAIAAKVDPHLLPGTERTGRAQAANPQAPLTESKSRPPRVVGARPPSHTDKT